MTAEQGGRGESVYLSVEDVFEIYAAIIDGTTAQAADHLRSRDALAGALGRPASYAHYEQADLALVFERSERLQALRALCEVFLKRSVLGSHNKGIACMEVEANLENMERAEAEAVYVEGRSAIAVRATAPSRRRMIRPKRALSAGRRRARRPRRGPSTKGSEGGRAAGSAPDARAATLAAIVGAFTAAHPPATHASVMLESAPTS